MAERRVLAFGLTAGADVNYLWGRRHLGPHHRHDDGQHPSSRDLDHLGFGSGHDRACHSLSPDGRPYREESNRLYGEVEKESVDEGNGHGGWEAQYGHDHLRAEHRDQSQTARTLMEEYEPTGVYVNFVWI